MQQRNQLVWTFVIVCTIATTSSSNAEKTARSYQPPRTADGKPDLQGVWTNASITTLERNARYKKLALSKDEVAAATASHPQVVRQQTDDAEDEGTAKLDGSDLAKGRGYNAFWIDPGTEFGLVKGEYRTSWIVDPDDGQIPYTAQGRKTVDAFEHQRHSFDGPETRPPAERCLIIGGRVGPPMVSGLYNNNYQIVQTKDHVVILVEMIRHARIIPLKNRQHAPAALAPLFGDSVGWWEGDTLVVETINFKPLQAASVVSLTPHGRVIERFTRVSAQQIFYEFTVEDPFLYKQPWRGEMSFNASQDEIYEYACHEGNYAMSGILAGAREQEKRAVEKK
ncbi:MAG: hypothetical protein H7Y02_12155 [Candidatus Obscuribacterales bacterium]|nr:hypothetical protein [Steroidobacteraceae bacterium]